MPVRAPTRSRTSLSLPDFSADAPAWFDALGLAIREPSWSVARDHLLPGLWTDHDGHPWRLVRTPRGIEVRPDLVSPFMRLNGDPIISALGIGEEIEIELSTRDGRWIGRFDIDELDVGALGRAMLVQQRLAHDNLSVLFGSADRR